MKKSLHLPHIFSIGFISISIILFVAVIFTSKATSKLSVYPIATSIKNTTTSFIFSSL